MLGQRETVGHAGDEVRDAARPCRRIDSIEPIGLPDITPALARESGFLGVVDLLKVANHGKGSKVYLVRFHYIRPRRKPKSQAN